MQFLVNMCNHSDLGQRSLEDVVGILGHQLRALGHQCIWNPKNDKFLTKESGINIMVEGFTDGSVAEMKTAHEKGARFIILATEEPTPKGFNYGTQPEMVKRQDKFPEAAQYCEGIIHLVPGEHVSKWYSQFAPTSYTELGYAPTLVRTGDFEPKFDFGFFGSLSYRRDRILHRLAKRSGREYAVRVCADFPSQEDRDRQMREARVIVQVRKNEKLGLVSSSRCNTALCVGRPVLAEPHLLSKPWDEIVTFASDMDNFYAMALLMRGTWRGVHAAQMAKFKEKLSPELCIGKALADIGIDLGEEPISKVA